jgi:hypothetical protein
MTCCVINGAMTFLRVLLYIYNSWLTSIGDIAAKNIVRHCEKMIKLIDYFLLPYAGPDTLSLWLEMYLSLMT